MVITSRGYGYPTAKEAALKLMETSYIPALSYSGADLLHGPSPWSTTSPRSSRSSPTARAARRSSPCSTGCAGAAPTWSSSAPGPGGAGLGRVRPAHRGVAEELQPILEILPLQLLAYEVTIARGQDPDAPRALAKVTETR